ncbi:hypothetical protein D3H35_28090 [Cohnella faecalis]|uniref:Uncharacterized protein n=1 Tax=Cohnella faecalis TaxID=2315694 RepID=A0A398CBH2_9BACL|nr:hypothetical protein D3H35_28090 [Cohnella faecalis]
MNLFRKCLYFGSNCARRFQAAFALRVYRFFRMRAEIEQYLDELRSVSEPGSVRWRDSNHSKSSTAVFVR